MQRQQVEALPRVTAGKFLESKGGLAKITGRGRAGGWRSGRASAWLLHGPRFNTQQCLQVRAGRDTQRPNRKPWRATAHQHSQY